MAVNNKSIYLYIAIIAITIVGLVVYLGGKKEGSIVPIKTVPVVTQPPVQATSTSQIAFSKAEPLTFPDNKLDTSDWQTYRNEEFGFEVKYPRDWQVFLLTPEEGYKLGSMRGIGTRGEAVAVLYLSKKYPAADGSDVATTRTLSIHKEALESFVGKYSNIDAYLKKTILVNDAYGVVLGQKLDGEWREDDRSIVLSNDNFLYDFNMSAGLYTSVFQKILLSFKFTK